MSKQRTHGGIRRLVSGLLCLALMLGLLPSGIILPAQAHWADPYGQKLVEWGVMRGDISGNLNLAKPITRAELVTMINRAYGYTRKAGVPFTDVPSSKWYADDIDIAYNAGYFKGVSSNRAAPESNVTREQAAVFLARNLMLQETVGETLGFSDTRTLSEWSRGLIGAAVKEGVLNGYADGSFKPQSNITRGELAAMLVRAIGTPVDKAGDHTLGHVYGNVTLNTSNVNLRNTTIYGNLYLTGGIDLGHVLLENVTVLGRIVISGAGEAIEGQESIVLRNVEAEEMVVDSLRTHTVTIRVQGVTDIPLTTVRANSFINDASWDGYGLARIELRGEPGRKFQLAGSIKEVVNYTPASDLQFVKGSAEKVTVDEEAIASNVLVDKNTRLDELNLDVGTKVTGQGDIKNLNVGSSGSVVEQLPDQIVIRPGIDADIDGTVMGNSDAAELSAEPRLNAGYPYMKNVSPNQADGVFSGSKPGTIYWAISAVADGSVSEEDLIENPAYGGNIFQEQAGAINTTSANTEYIGKVEQLEPDGSYYVSAILVDGRGKRSPLKVAAFTTPDDTKPDFNKKDSEPNTEGKHAYMSKITTEIAQATVMANKDCLLYWALLPDGAKAPTPQEFKTGSLGGNYGSGSLSMVKNAEISITVNRRKLQEKTPYVLFLWLTDHNGAQSMDKPLEIKFSTPDETPPIVIEPSQEYPYEEKGANVKFSMNEAPSTLFWVVVPEGDRTFISPGTTDAETAEIMADLRTKIKVEGGQVSNGVSGKTSVQNAYAATTFHITGLDTTKFNTNNYTLYYIGKDAAGNYSDKVGTLKIQTLDITPPSVELNFLDAVDGRPRASSGIEIIFSETVRGGTDDENPTFLEYYQAVRDAGADANLLEDAKKRLSDELIKHIQFWYVDKEKGPQLITPCPDSNTGSGTDGEWVIDFHNATVEQKIDGQMVITLPNTGRPETSAIQMDSGVTYYFQLIGVYDTAPVSPNGVEDDASGNCKIPSFTTIYGQVDITQNMNITEIQQPGSTAAPVPGVEYGLNGIRLDIVMEMKPDSTDKMPLTEVWDLIMWSDEVPVRVQLYWQEIDENGKDLGWMALPNGGTTAGSLNINTAPGRPAASLGSDVKGGQPAVYQPVKETLQEGHIYRLGVHYTMVDLVSESDPKGKPDAWNEVKMRFSLIAGVITEVRSVSTNPSTVYDSKLKEGKFTEIGFVLPEGEEKILTGVAPFQNTKVPSFQGTYPMFETSSGSIEMSVLLTNPGRVNVAVAEPGKIPLTLKNDTVINKDNDGRNLNLTQLEELYAKGIRSYLPEDGADRSKNAKYISYMPYTAPGLATVTNPAENYKAPENVLISQAEYYFKDNPDIHLPDGKIEFTNFEVTGTIQGLKADTVYYVFVVLQGMGDAGDTVEVYRVKTEVAKPPVVEITNSRTAATMKTPKEDGTEIYYAVANLNSLPSTMNKEYSWGGTTYKVWEAMMHRTSDGHTVFDTYVDDVEANLRDEVYRWICKADTQSMDKGPLMRYGPFNGPEKNQDFTEDMNSETAEYVVFATARNKGAEDTASSYGFAAARNLFYPNVNLPEFVGEETKGYPGAVLIRLNPSKVYTFTDQNTNLKNDATNPWQKRDDLHTLLFDGTLSLQFTYPVYYAVSESGSVDLKEVWAATPEFVAAEIAKDPDLKAISILDIMTMSGGTWTIANSKKGAASYFTLTYKGISDGDNIFLPAPGRISNNNPDITASAKHLTVTLDTTLTTKHYSNDPDNIKQPMNQPGFRATWK